jgi:adenine-specific DNA-methyltransferase
MDSPSSAIAIHLEKRAEMAKKRYDKGDYWWELRTCDYYDEFEKTKIIYPNILKRPEFILDDQSWYTNQKCFIISLADKHLLGILNSKLMHFWLDSVLPKLRGGFYEPSYVYFKNFPVSMKSNKKIVEIVNSVLNLYKQLENIKPESQRQQIQRAIDHSEKRIDTLVYEIYGLDEEDIALIEQT